MKGHEPYSIDLARQPLGHSDHEFVLDHNFWALFPYSPVQEGRLVAYVSLEKSTSIVVLKVLVKGHVGLVCDRSGDPFDEPLEANDRVVYQLGEHYVEHSENLFEIPSGTQSLELSELFYNLIVVLLPMKRIHPDLRDANLPADDEGNLLVYSTPVPDEMEEHEPTPEELAANPFSKLLSLKNKN